MIYQNPSTIVGFDVSGLFDNCRPVIYHTPILWCSLCPKSQTWQWIRSSTRTLAACADFSESSHDLKQKGKKYPQVPVQHALAMKIFHPLRDLMHIAQ